MNVETDTYSNNVNNPFNVDLYQCCKGGVLTSKELRDLTNTGMNSMIDTCTGLITKSTNLVGLQTTQKCILERLKARGLNVSMDIPLQCLKATLMSLATAACLLLTVVW